MNKTNREILIQAINELSDTDLIFLRERLINNCEFILENKDKIIEEMKEDSQLYLQCVENILEKIKIK